MTNVAYVQSVIRLINKLTFILFVRTLIGTVCFPYSALNDNEFEQTVIGKQVKFTRIAKPAISNTENFVKDINSENNTTKYFTIKRSEFYFQWH